MKLLFSCLLFLFSLHIYTQPSLIKTLGVEQGLSNNHVVSITQDRDGFLWFGTEEGLNKFDGLRFIQYFKQNSDLSGNELNCVLADPTDPVIWIATQRDGLNAYNYEKDSLEIFRVNNNKSNSLITNDVTSIAPASDGNLWVSTYHRGVEYLDKHKKAFTHYNTATFPGFPSDNVWTIMDDNEGYLYIGHVSHGLSVISLKSRLISNYQFDASDPRSIPGNEVRRIYKDSNNNIWVGTDKGLVLFDKNAGEFIKPDKAPGSPLNSAIFDIRQTEDNMLWVATELDGVYVIDLKQLFFNSMNPLSMQHYAVGYNKYSLSNSSVRSVFQDSFKNIWLGTYGGGINFIGHSPSLFNKYDFSPLPEDPYSMNNRIALSLVLDANQQLWVGTDGGGINVFENGKRNKVFSKESGDLSHNSIQAMWKDESDNIWIGTFMNGVNYFNQQSGKFVPVHINGRSDQDVRCFFEDHNRNMWIGTSTGIFVVKGSDRSLKAHYTRQHNQLPEDFVRSIGQDQKGRIWIGTFGGGLAIYDQDMRPIRFFNEHNGFCSNSINDIFTDSQGQTWVATGEGLVCFSETDSLNYRVYGRTESLTNTYIRAITEDKEGNIWFSTNAGISCFIQQTETFQHYGHIGRTPMNSFVSAVIKDVRKEMIYFGSINGVYYFEPFTVLKNNEAPPAIITEMRIYETKSPQSEEKAINYFNEQDSPLTLTHTQNTFSLFFTVQDYSLSDKVYYVSRLKGIDETWQVVEGNSVTFRNMSPGIYQFQVSSRIGNQDRSDNISTLTIRIKPPFWLSWWAKTFYSLFVLFFILAVFYGYKKKVDMESSLNMEKKKLVHEQELSDERLRFYTNITHELRTPLTLILGPLEDLQKDTVLQPKQYQKLTLVRQSAQRLLDLITQLLEFRKVETQNKTLCVNKGNLAELVNEIGLKYKELNTKKEVEIVIDNEEKDLFLYFDHEVIQTVLDNLLTNAIKNTVRGEIRLSLSRSWKNEISYTHISVADTGYGIPEEEKEKIFERYYQVKNNRQVSGTGIGLALIKKLAVLHDGEITVESEIGKGSCFRFSLLTHHDYPNAMHGEENEMKQIKKFYETAEAESFSPANGKDILLVVEDNTDIRNYIADSFSDVFEVITASDGEEGCRIAFHHVPDIIVSDIMMPGMDGITFCKRIKEDIRTSHIPLILLTAKTTLQDKEAGYVSGADSYLTKPFSATLLRIRIDNLLENRRKLAEQFKLNLKLDSKNVLLNQSLNQLDSEFIANVTRLIEDNLEQEKIDVGFLSDALSMSNSTLYRKIKALTGISTNEFIRKIKMNRAEQLLLTGKYTVSEVGYQVGMNSPVYFRQCFKEEFGVAPSDYIKKIKAE